MNDETISEKVKLQHALKTEDGGETEFRADDISRMKRLAGINQRLDADKEDGVVNFDGIFTGVANGEIPVSEGEYAFLRSLEEGEKRDVDGDGDIDADDYLAAKDKAIKKAKGEEVDESYWWKEGANDSERLRQLAGLKAESFTEATHEEVDEGKKRDVDGDGDIDSDDWKAAKDKAIKKSMKNESEELDEDALGDKIKSKSNGALQKIVDDMEGEEVSGSAALQYRAARAELKRRKTTNESEMNRIRELAGMAPQMAPQVTEYPGPEGDYNDLVHFTVDDERVHEVIMAKFGEYIEHVEEGMTIPESLWGKVQEVAADHGGEAIELGDMDGEPMGSHDMSDDAEALASAGWGSDEDYGGGYDESQMFPEGSLSRHMIEMIVDEMNKGKESEEISEELSFNPDHVSKVVEFVLEKWHGKKKKSYEAAEEVDETKEEDLDEDTESYLVNRDKAIKERIANADSKEEIDETGDEEVDESYWWKEGANDSERLRQLAGIKAEAFTEAANDEEVDESKDEEVDEATETEEVDEELTKKSMDSMDETNNEISQIKRRAGIK